MLRVIVRGMWIQLKTSMKNSISLKEMADKVAIGNVQIA